MSWAVGTGKADRKQRLRFLKALCKPNTLLKRDSCKSGWTCEQASGESALWFEEQLVRSALAAGLVQQTHDGGLAGTAAARFALKRCLSGGDGFQDQHRSFAKAGQKPVKNGLEGPIKVNQRESPLARYAARKDKSGRPLLEPEQVRAGERLREDYTFAQLTPSLSRGWQTERISGSGPQAGSADMTTDVIAARARVQRILSSMEPVLASVAVDVCCHLKGLEVVEAERDWPSRSARLLLQVALSSLATRYGERVQGPPGKG